MPSLADERGLIPKLRFPEFRDAGEWEEKALSQLGELVSGLTYSPDDVRDEGLLVLRSSNVQNGMIVLDDNVYVRADVKGANPSKPNDILICVRNGSKSLIGKNALVPEGMPLCTHGAFMSVFRSASAKFITQLFQTEAYEKQVSADLGATINSINGNQLKKYKFFVPSPPEQQKIADSLASLDELLTLEAQKLDTLKTHKKGLMQQLFPAEGETLPKLRFPEFRDTGEWEEKQIGDLKPFVTSGSRGWAAYYANQGSLFVRITNLTRESIYLDLTDTKFVKLPQEANEGVRTQLKEFDVLISITADIGIIGYVDASVSSPAYINQHIALVRFGASQVHSKFVSYFLASERSQRLFRASTDNGTKAGMSLIVVQKIQVVLPTLPEQQKIANCLASLDDLITAQTQTLAALKTHKKGLMQQLFPALSET